MIAFKHFALVAAGGAAGSMLRYALTLCAIALGAAAPVGTLAANALGCLAGGVLLGTFASMRSAQDPWRLLLITGALGGLTTFSALSIETVQWWREGRVGLAALNMGGNVVLGVACVWLGLLVARGHGA